MSSTYFLILIAVAVAFEVVADILFKLSFIQSKTIYIWAGVSLYTVGTIAWAFSLKYEHLSKAISIFTIINLIAIIAVGVLFFNEQLPFVNKIGIGLGIISVILMQI